MKIAPTLALISLAAVGGTLFFTNPTEDEYAEHLSSNITIEAQNALCDPEGFSSWLGRVGEALSSACQGILAGGERLSDEEVQDLIKENTDYRNLFFFSTYETQTPVGNYRAIGVFDRFILRENAEGE